MRLRHVRIRLGRAEQFAMPFVGVPSRETITRVGCCREGASSLVAGGTQRPVIRILQRQCPCNRDCAAVGEQDRKRIGKRMLETAAAFIAVAVTHAHLVFETRLGLGNGRRREAHRKVVAATGIVKAEREGYVRLTEVRSDGQRAVGRGKDLHLGLQRRGGIRASDVDAEQTAGRDAVVADAVALEIVGHTQRIAVYTGVHLIVARDRDVERMGRITSYVEVRRVIPSQIYPIIESPVAARGGGYLRF